MAERWKDAKMNDKTVKKDTEKSLKSTKKMLKYFGLI